MFSFSRRPWQDTELLTSLGEGTATLSEPHDPKLFFAGGATLFVWPNFTKRVVQHAQEVRSAPPLSYRTYELKKSAWSDDIRHQLPETHLFQPDDLWFIADLIGAQRHGGGGPLLIDSGVGNVFYVEIHSVVHQIGVYWWEGRLRIGSLDPADEPVDAGHRIFAKLS